MKLKDETQILDKDFRKLVIQEIFSEENQTRKRIIKRRYDILKDNTKKYVIEKIRQEHSPDVLPAILSRVSNVSISKKIINKKSTIYKNGAKRITEKKRDQKNLDELVRLLDFKRQMKKTNEYVEAFKNTVGYPKPFTDFGSGKKKLKIDILMPFLYDVIEDEENPEMARVYILSDYVPPQTSGLAHRPPGLSGLRESTQTQISRDDFYEGQYINPGNQIDEIIADVPDDFGAGKEELIWWSDNFHFTSDFKGDVIPGKQEPNLENPLGEMPFIPFQADQDGRYWAVGGEDIFDCGILTNVLLTDLYYIERMQGFGIFHLFGKGIPKNLKIGPSDGVFLEVKSKDDPTPQIGFASPSPQLSAMMEAVEQYIALNLSTNNLEPGVIKGKLSLSNAQSGIQEMIRKADLVDELDDKKEIFRQGERKLFKIIFKWLELLRDRNQLDDSFAELGRLNPETVVNVEFGEMKTFTTDKERMDIMKSKIENGVASLIDAIMEENPGMTKEEAKAKAIENLETKIELQRLKLKSMIPEGGNNGTVGVENNIQNAAQDGEDSGQTGSDQRSREFPS